MLLINFHNIINDLILYYDDPCHIIINDPILYYDNLP